MEHFIIGSRLFKNLFPDSPKVQDRCKDDADYDILVEREPLKPTIDYFKGLYGHKTEVHCIPILWELFVDMQHDIFQGGKILSMRDIYFTLKASHVAFDKVHKKKTFYDLFLMSKEGCQIIEPLFFELYDFWTEKFGEKWRADFSKESSDFFDDAVSREEQHDELHKLVAFYDQPAFKFLQEPDQTTVWVCPEKFKATTEHIRQRVIIEEAQTLALEREIIPQRIKNKNVAYQKYIEGLIDRLAPVWMVPYITNNFHFFLTHTEDYGKTNLQCNQEHS